MKRLLKRLSGGLSDAVMGFLALAALAVAIVPALFDISPLASETLGACEWLIVGLFALEYVTNLVLATSRWAFVRDPWRIVDLAIVAGPFLSLLPQVNDSLRSTPVLRLLRFARAAVFGARASGAALRERRPHGRDVSFGPRRVTSLGDGRGTAPRDVEWGEFLQWVENQTGQWFHAESLSAEEFNEVATKSGIPAASQQSFRSDSAYPHIDVSERYSTLFVWLPVQRAGQEIGGRRVDTLLLFTGASLFSVSRYPTGLHEAVAAELPRIELPESSFVSRMVCTFLRVIVSRYEDVSNHLEHEVRRMEALPTRESSPGFFEDAFLLKRKLSAAKADLWRLKGMLDSLVEQRAILKSSNPAQEAYLRRLSRDAEYLHKTVDENRDAVLSLIDLHLNVVSFDMNRFMRLLAAVSVMGLIPAVVGGLLGMNLSGNPWPFTLAQVTFGVSMGMLVCLYLFLVKGWLR